MTHRPDHIIIDATFEDGDPGQDATRYGREPAPWRGLLLLGGAALAGSAVTLTGLWLMGAL